MVTTRAKAVKPPIASNKPLKLFLLKMSVISIKFTKRNFIQMMIWILSQKKLSLVNNTMLGSVAQAQGIHNNHDANFVPNCYHTPRKTQSSSVSVLPIGRAHNGLIPYP